MRTKKTGRQTEGLTERLGSPFGNPKSVKKGAKSILYLRRSSPLKEGGMRENVFKKGEF